MLQEMNIITKKTLVLMCVQHPSFATGCNSLPYHENYNQNVAKKFQVILIGFNIYPLK